MTEPKWLTEIADEIRFAIRNGREPTAYTDAGTLLLAHVRELRAALISVTSYIPGGVSGELAGRIVAARQLLARQEPPEVKP